MCQGYIAGDYRGFTVHCRGKVTAVGHGSKVYQGGFVREGFDWWGRSMKQETHSSLHSGDLTA